MILLISTCKYKLHENEFVLPLFKSLENCQIKHYSDTINFSKYSHIIICGTALKDNEYLENLDKFEWLNKIEIPVLGICSGMQIIAILNGAEIKKKTEIGLIEIKTIKKNKLFEGDFYAYNLHSNSLINLNKFEILAQSSKTAQVIKHKQKKIFGIMFHPEVRNKNIITNFINSYP